MQLLEKKCLLKSPIFSVEKLDFENAGHPYLRLTCPDWVNVLPVTSDGQAVLIKQYRAGVLAPVLETPGGLIEKDEDPILAAARETEEETGYSSQNLIPLANFSVNPAMQNNRIHLYLAIGCEISLDRKHFPDQEEDITNELFPIEKLEEMVRLNQVDHSLSALNIMLALKHLK